MKVTEHKGFRMIERGAPATRSITADYYCERHGRFELAVDRTEQGDAPAQIYCPHLVPTDQDETDPDYEPQVACGLPSVWCISAPVTRVNPYEAIKGKWQKPERPTWTDTSDLGEGASMDEWQQKRDAVWEERRKADVMKFARENYERPIGGD